MLATQDGVNMSALCRRFEISRKTGYKWLRRFEAEGVEGLQERSRRPKRSPNRTPEVIEEAICELRREHPAWGGRKLRECLRNQADQGKLPFEASAVPAGSTCQAIIERHGLIEEESAGVSPTYKRFEKASPNELWQMDFKGHFALVDGTRCHPLTIVDDHSRYALELTALGDERRASVRERLTCVFRRHGLPRRILCDNGLPWGVPTAQRVGRPLYTQLNAWLFRLGVDVMHGSPYHPQTQGKIERFHRTLDMELLHHGSFHSLSECQERFDDFRSTYNLKRPHESLEMDLPATHYTPSGRSYPKRLPKVDYPEDSHVRKVSAGGQLWFAGNKFYVGEAFNGHPVALRPHKAEESVFAPLTPEDPEAVTWSIYFCDKEIGVIPSTHPTR
jgi:transposase InsO family protein